jgi:TolB-like protein
MERSMKKMLKGWKRSSVIMTLIALACILSVASAGRADPKPSLAVIPFFTQSHEDPTQGNVCPVCQRAARRGDIPHGALDSLTRLLNQKMEVRKEFRVSSVEEVEKHSELFRSELFQTRPVKSSIELGRALNVDYVLFGFLYRFDERIGSSLGVEKPASVGYDLHLFRVKDGKMVWSGRFDETQQSLTDDLFKVGAFLRRKAVWLKAEELASVGMDEILNDMPRPEELEQVR